MEALLRDPTQVLLRPEEQLLLQILDKYFSIFFCKMDKKQKHNFQKFSPEKSEI